MNMKTHRILKLFIFIFIASVLISCKKDETAVVVDSRDAFVGTWNVSDHQITKANYQVRIYKDANYSEKVWLINFHGTTDTAFAYVSDKNITVTSQVLSTTHLSTGGTGLMTGTTKIDFEYYISDGAQQDTIQAVYQK
jgi:hypothetical protein